jgi:hypothetical protein
MFQVRDVWEEAQKIAGYCDEKKLLQWLSDAVTLTANKADFEGWKGYLDICTTDGGQCITLPREVETVYGVNINGNPSVGFGQLFNFHLNGLGDKCTPCGWSWQDMGGFHSVYRDIATPSRLVAYVSSPADNGKELIVHGFDSSGNPLRREVNGQWLPGYQVPTIYGYAIPDSTAPVVARITGVVKDATAGPVRLSTIDSDGVSGQVLAVYEPDEKLPQYRRIKLNRTACWVRIAYRRTTPLFTSIYDRVPLKSRIGFLLAFRAVKFYSETDIANAHAFEADAARLELEAQNATEAPTVSPIQVLNGNGLLEKSDYDIR